MELGLYHSCFMDWPLETLYSWMADRDYHYVEIHGGPRYRHISWNEVALGHDKAIRTLGERHGIKIVDIMYGGLNFLSPDAGERRSAQEYAKMLLTAAQYLDIPSISIFTGRNPLLDLDENLRQLPDALAPILAIAEKRGVRVALENCPMAHDWPPQYNIAINPAIWREIFAAIPSDVLGLNFDPSHLVWQGIDYVHAVNAFKDRIVLAQAKDSEILPHVQREAGILDAQFWRHRIPGQGDVDWNRFMAALVDSGYQGPLVIEHEDPFYEGSVEAVQAGLDLTRAHLRKFSAMTRRKGAS